MTTQQAPNGELPTNGTPDNGQVQEIVKADDYKSLQSEFTKTRQSEIALAIKLVEGNKKSILELEKDLQNKVIKKIYGLDNLEELTIVHGENFYETSDDEKEDDENEERITRIEKEYKILKYNSEKKEIEEAINSFRNENKILGSMSDFDEKIKSELKYISNELPIKERVNRAGRSAFGAINSSDAIYAKIMETSSSNSSTPENKNKVSEKGDTSIADAILAKHRINKRI